jgi:membrane-bound ClpP family serine protease
VTAEVLIAVIAVVILFELFEHVIIPLIGARGSRRRRAVTGAEGMVGKVVEVRRWSGREGTVSVDGELWRARSRTPLAAGDQATVVAVSNLTLRVEPVPRSIAPDDSLGPHASRSSVPLKKPRL